MEVIEDLEAMNDELVDDAKRAKNNRCVAMKLYAKSKQAAVKRFEKIQIERDEKNMLKDKLTEALKTQESQHYEIAHLLRAQESQHKLLEEYKTMIEYFKSSRLSLKREFKVRRQGGSSWPLWVTEVCCQLLVDGSPPSAIPASMGILFSALYGEEPKKVPSLNFVRQC